MPPVAVGCPQNLGKALDRINAYSEIDFCFYGSRERRFLMVGAHPGAPSSGHPPPVMCFCLLWAVALTRVQSRRMVSLPPPPTTSGCDAQDIVEACKFYDRDTFIDCAWNFDYACELDPVQLL